MNRIFVQGSIILLSLSLWFASCTDDKLKVGLTILPESDQLEANADTIPIECFTLKGIPNYVNHAVFNQSFNDQTPVGIVNDEVFGETTANLVIEFAINREESYLDKDTIYATDEVVSLKLFLNTTDQPVYGDSDAEALTFNSLLLRDQYTFDALSNQEVPSDYFDDITSRAVNTEHYVSIDSDKISQLDSASQYSVVELDMELADELFLDAFRDSTTRTLNIIPGMMLSGTINSGTRGALHTFSMLNSKMLLEYRTKIDVEELDSVGNVIDTVLVDTNLFVSYVVNKYQSNYRNTHLGRNAEIESVFKDTTLQYDNLFLQSLGGTMGFLRLDSLDLFKMDKADKIGVNLAELVFPISKNHLSDTAMFSLPQRIMAFQFVKDESLFAPTTSKINAQYTIPDAFYFNYLYYNGFLDEEKLEYRINVTEYVHQYLKGNIDYLQMGVATAPGNISTNDYLEYKTPGRVVLNTGIQDLSEPAFLRVIYTVIE
jgi:hypothetical protein